MYIILDVIYILLLKFLKNKFETILVSLVTSFDTCLARDLRITRSEYINANLHALIHPTNFKKVYLVPFSSVSGRYTGGTLFREKTSTLRK